MVVDKLQKVIKCKWTNINVLDEHKEVVGKYYGCRFISTVINQRRKGIGSNLLEAMFIKFKTDSRRLAFSFLSSDGKKLALKFKKEIHHYY